jgi:MFS family permease
VAEKTAVPAESAPRPSGGLPLLQVLGSANYRKYWYGGLGWYMGRWVWQLTSAYVVFTLTGSSFLTQMVGVAFTLPMLIIGVMSGVLADAFERRQLMLFGHVVSLFVAVFGVALLFTGAVEAWHLLVLTGALGVINALDMAARRTFVSDLVPRDKLPIALALESIGMTLVNITGSWLSGSLVDYLPMGAAGAGAPYILVLFGVVWSILLLSRVRTDPQPNRIPLRAGTVASSMQQSVSAALHNRAMIGILGVTFLANFFFFAYIPLVPVFAKTVLNVSPTLMGVLSSAQAVGSLIGAVVIATRARIDKGWKIYVFGMLIAYTGLFFFSLSRIYPLSVVFLLLAGIGTSGFGTMQATLVLNAAGESMRGRAMGVLTVAIGAQPLGMMAMGAVAETLGPDRAVTASALLGFILLSLWTWRSKAMRKL